MAAPTFTRTDGRVQEYPPSSARKWVVGNLVVDGSVGAAALDIPATLFGLTFVDGCAPLVKNDNTLIVSAAPAYDNASILTKAAGTAAPANVPAGTYKVEVRGW